MLRAEAPSSKDREKRRCWPGMPSQPAAEACQAAASTVRPLASNRSRLHMWHWRQWVRSAHARWTGGGGAHVGDACALGIGGIVSEDPAVLDLRPARVAVVVNLLLFGGAGLGPLRRGRRLAHAARGAVRGFGRCCLERHDGAGPSSRHPRRGLFFLLGGLRLLLPITTPPSLVPCAR